MLRTPILFVGTLVALLAAPFARADGFVCDSIDGKLTVRVFNQTQPSAGTRNAAVLVLSDNSVSPGNRTIARFQAELGRLDNYGARYTADVDLRFRDSSRGGEYVGGTRLMYVDTFTLDVAFDYSAPVEAGALLDANLSIRKRNGKLIGVDLSCRRYLKN